MSFKFLKIYFYSMIFFVLSIIFTVYLVDPLQFFRKASWYIPCYSTQQRYQNPALIRTHNYNSVVIGTSMTENFLPDFVNDQLDLNILKLSISGSNLYEQRLLLDLAVQKESLKKVIWCFDFFLHKLSAPIDKANEEFGEFPYYLYSKNPFNFIKYLFIKSTISDSFTILFQKMGFLKELLNEQKINLNQLNCWYDQCTFSSTNVLNNFALEFKKDHHPEIDFINIDLIYKNINENFISVIRKNRHVNFVIYFPPYSILYYKYLSFSKNKDLFEDFLKIKKYLIQEIYKEKNVILFDFQDVSEIICNFDNFKDLVHHSKSINEYIIKSIASNKHIINLEKPYESLYHLRKQVDAYKLNGLS